MQKRPGAETRKVRTYIFSLTSSGSKESVPSAGSVSELLRYILLGHVEGAAGESGGVCGSLPR